MSTNQEHDMMRVNRCTFVMYLSKFCYIATLILSVKVGAHDSSHIYVRAPAFLQRDRQHQFGYTPHIKNVHHQSSRYMKYSPIYLRGGANDTGDAEKESTSTTDGEGADEPIRAKFLSFFRPRQSATSAAASVERSNSNADKIPHGPTGGGYASIRASSENCQEDGDLMLMKSEDTGKGGSTSTSAFVVNNGHSIQSMKAMLSGTVDKTEETINTDIGSNATDLNTTDVDDEGKFDSLAGTNATADILLNATGLKQDNPLDAAMNIAKLDVSSGNTTLVNVSPSGSVADNNDHDYTSTGYWAGIDLIASFGLSTLIDEMKISKVLRPVRKAAARATGLHGFLSGKPIPSDPELNNGKKRKQPTVISIDQELGIHDATASEAELSVRQLAKPLTRRQQIRMERRAANRNRQGRRWGLRRGNNLKADPEYIVIPVRVLDESPDALERRRRKRVEEIDDLLKRGSARLMELQCEKDDLQQAPNPLFNYTKQYDESVNKTFGDVRTSREFNFPPQSLVEDYIEELISSGRLICLNHTDLWQNQQDNDLDDDDIGDDLFTPSANAGKLYQKSNGLAYPQNSGGGSWLLRTGFGNGGSLGEKLGESIETQAYKAVSHQVMGVLARILSALHGINVMNHSDIRLYVEEDPDLPPIDKDFGSMRENYAQQAIKQVIQKGAKKKRKHGTKSHSHAPSRRHGHELSEEAFIQRDAVVETLISHCQISAPLLKLFPIDWQRAIVGNIITLVTAIVSDFADGIQLQILGHSLSFSFKPITEADLFQHIGVGGFRQNHRRSRPHEFEYAVWATAQDISKSLSFLGDGWLCWLEKKIGGGILISQLSNLIARLVLTLIDEVLSGARLDLWSSQANGPRLYAAMEYRAAGLNKEETESI